MSTDVIVSREKLIELVVTKLVRSGINEEHATVVADVLVHANLRGVNSHGVLRTEHYIKRIKEGGLNLSPSFSVKDTGPCTAIFDGDNGLGHVVTKEAMDYAIKMAEKNGIGMVAVVNSSHCGALSYFAKQATQSGMIGMVQTQTDKVVVPYGGAKPYFGTNPIAYGFPAKNNKPIILDMATSNVAYGKVLHAREAAQSIPDSWGVDGEGMATTDPNKVEALLPFAGPKGYGMALIIDVFSGLLTGSAFGPHITPMYGDYNKKRKLGHMLCAYNIAAFTDKETFLDNMDQMINELHEVPVAPGFKTVMVPGEPEQLKEEEHLKNGIPITKTIYDYLIAE